MHLDEGRARRQSLSQVPDGSTEGHPKAEPVPTRSEPRRVSRVLDVDCADAAWPDEIHELGEDRKASTLRNVLEDDVGVHQVERAIPEQSQVGREVHVRAALRAGVAPRLLEHCLRDVYADHLVETTGKWNHQPADAAPEVEDAALAEGGGEAIDELQHLLDVALARLEESRLRVVVDDRRVGLRSTELPPYAIGPPHGVNIACRLERPRRGGPG